MAFDLETPFPAAIIASSVKFVSLLISFSANFAAFIKRGSEEGIALPGLFKKEKDFLI